MQLRLSGKYVNILVTLLIENFKSEEKESPLAKADGAYYLELYHGSTIAFKDMALSILPHLMTTAARKNHVDREIVILTATSGDTGKAAMAGFADVPGTRIIVFYPKDGVSKVQELQMRTQKGDNRARISMWWCPQVISAISWQPILPSAWGFL